jgi:hypothetical protein
MDRVVGGFLPPKAEIGQDFDDTVLLYRGLSGPGEVRASPVVLF